MNNLQPENRPLGRVDESHAKAICYNWMRTAIKQSEISLNKCKEKLVKNKAVRGKRGVYLKEIIPQINAVSPITVVKSVAKTKHRNTVPDYLWVVIIKSRQHIKHDDIDYNKQYTPLILTEFGCKDRETRNVPFSLISDHFLGRLLMRTQAKSLIELFEPLT